MYGKVVGFGAMQAPPRRPGRPLRGTAPRTRRIPGMLTEAEWQQLQATAKAHGLSPADYVRAWVFRLPG